MTTPEQSRRYRLKNPEKVRAWKRAYYARNRQAIRQRQNDSAKAKRAVLNARLRERYAANPALRVHKRAANRQWYAKNRERQRIAFAIYRINNLEHLRQREKQRRLEHPERFIAYERKRYARDGVRRRAYHKAYRITHPTVIAASNQRRRARLRNAPRVEKIDNSRLIVRDRDICHICSKKIRAGERSIDHLIPLIHGGSHTEDNVALAHIRCNSRRGAGRLPAQLRLFG